MQVRAAKCAGFIPRRSRSRVKSPSKCTKRQQRNIKRKRESSCRDSLQWLEKDGYARTKLVLTNSKTGETEEIVLEQEKDATEDEQVNVDRLNMILYLKDRHNISGIVRFIKWVLIVHYLFPM